MNPIPDWLREHLMPLGLMAALQLLCFVLAGRRSQGGDSSVRKMAIPKETGTAITSAMREVTSVP